MADQASDIAGAIGLMSSTIRLLRITSDLRAEIDIITLEGDSCRDAISKFADSLSGGLEGRRTRTLSYSYKALSYTWGEDNHNQLELDAKTLLKNIYEVRETEEEIQRPIIFVAHNSGEVIVEKSLAISQRFPEMRTLIDSTLGILFLDSLSKPIRIRKEEIPRLLSNPHYRRTRPLVWRWLNPNRHVKRLGGILLPPAQIVCILLMGNYHPHILKGTNHYTYNLSLKSVHRLDRQEVHSECGLKLPTSISQPSLTTFIFTCLAYGIFAMTFYNLNAYHKYQQLILIIGILIGIFCSIYLHQQDTSLNVVTTILPASITFALVLSALIHLIAGDKFIAEEENVLRVLDTWAEKFVASDNEKRDLEKARSY